MPLRIIKKDPSYRWVILSISVALMIVVNGMTFGGPTVFDDIILNTLTTADGQSISRGELKLRETIMIWSAACFGFLTGIFADKYGVKPIIMIGLEVILFLLINPKKQANFKPFIDKWWANSGLNKNKIDLMYLYIFF